MNLKQLKYVIVLAEQGSFSRAAEELNISQPSLSQYVRKIESELGVELFDRSGSVVRLTDAGNAYIEAGRRIINIEHQLMSSFSDIKDNKSGNIIIGVSPHRSVCLLPAVISEFREEYPGMNITVDERVGYGLLERAEHGEYDICITTAPVDTKIFDCENILKDECVIAVPKGSAVDKKLAAAAKRDKKRNYPAVDIRLIDKADFISLPEPQIMQRIMTGICEDYDISVNTIVTCTSLSASMALVKAGVGAAMVPMSVTTDYRDSVCCYSVTEDIPHRDIVVVYRKGQVLNRAVRRFIDLLKQINN
ncbi:MAG: LysR family transcriptional regulator [Lachnospiraceae bacterium]|nr:LysR family transcriptional regulator [Lachnospiraceae bacterium]